MSLLVTAAKRLIRKNHGSAPPWPVEARDGYKSMIFSMDDQKPGPSKRLLDLSLAATRRIVAGEVDLSDIAEKVKAPNWFTVWPGEHYALLAALMLELKPQTVVEVGTFSGLSSLAMKKYLPPNGRIVTFDVVPWKAIEGTHLRDEDFADGQLKQIVADLSDDDTFEKCRDLLECAEFLFIDAPKDGIFEYRLVEKLQTVHFATTPIVLFDDTKLWSMLRFWRLLPWPKLDLTSFGSWSGTGLAEIACPGNGFTNLHKSSQIKD